MAGRFYKVVITLRILREQLGVGSMGFHLGAQAGTPAGLEIRRFQGLVKT